MKVRRFRKSNKTPGLWIAILYTLLLVAVSACAQTNAALQRGKELLQKNDFAGAVQAGRAAAQEAPQDAEAWLLLGRAQFEMGEFDEAETSLAKIEPLTQDHHVLADVNDVLGNIYLLNQGELEQAQDCFQKEMAHTREANDYQGQALARYNLGLVLRKRDAHSDARKEFEEALKLETRDSQRVLYQSAMAEEALMTGDTASAFGTMQVVEQTAKKLPDVKARARALFTYGQLYTLAGEAERNSGVPTGADHSGEYFRTANAKLQEGFKVLRDAKVEDLYGEALGYKLFGNLVEIQGNVNAAIGRYQQGLAKAELLGRRIELVYDLNIRIADLSRLAGKEYILGAIDIGSKGVKGVLVSMVSDGKGKTAFKELYRKSVNTNLNASLAANNGNFSAQAMLDTGNAVRDLIRGMRDVRVQPFIITNIVVAGSSSLTQGKNKPELARQIYLATKEEAQAPAHRPNSTPETATSFVDSGKELFYGILGSINPEDRQSASLLDIGSGNGRWGYITVASNGRTSVAIDIPLGSVSLATAAARSKQDGEDYTAALERVADNQIGAYLQTQLKKNSPVAKRPKVYIVGGAAYALVTLLHPEAAKQDEIELTHEDLRRFYDLVKGGSAAKPYSPDISQIVNVDTHKLAQAQIDDVLHNVFNTREQLLSAAILLKMVESNALKPNQKLVFPRHGGWALGLAQYK